MMRLVGKRGPLGDLHLPDVEVTDDPATIGTVDLVLFTVKLWDTMTAADAIKPLLGGNTAVVSFQNSVVKGAQATYERETRTGYSARCAAAPWSCSPSFRCTSRLCIQGCSHASWNQRPNSWPP